MAKTGKTSDLVISRYLISIESICKEGLSATLQKSITWPRHPQMVHLLKGFLHVPNFLVSDAELLKVMLTEPQCQIDDQADILTKRAQYKRAAQILMVKSFIEDA